MTKQKGGVLPGLMAVLLAVGLAAFSAGSVAQTAGAKGVDPTYPLETKNMTIVTMYNQYQVMLEEITESQTQGAMGLYTKDAARWRSYIDALEAYLAFQQIQGVPDYAATHGRKHPLSDPLFPECAFKDNIYTCDLMDQVVMARDEMVVSGSNSITRTLHPDDAVRQNEFWTMMRATIDYMEQWTPLDEPITNAEDALGIAPPLTDPGQ